MSLPEALCGEGIFKDHWMYLLIGFLVGLMFSTLVMLIWEILAR